MWGKTTQNLCKKQLGLGGVNHGKLKLIRWQTLPAWVKYSQQVQVVTLKSNLVRPCISYLVVCNQLSPNLQAWNSMIFLWSLGTESPGVAQLILRQCLPQALIKTQPRPLTLSLHWGGMFFKITHLVTVKIPFTVVLTEGLRSLGDFGLSQSFPKRGTNVSPNCAHRELKRKKMYHNRISMLVNLNTEIISYPFFQILSIGSKAILLIQMMKPWMAGAGLHIGGCLPPRGKKSAWAWHSHQRHGRSSGSGDLNTTQHLEQLTPCKCSDNNCTQKPRAISEEGTTQAPSTELLCVTWRSWHFPTKKTLNLELREKKLAMDLY